MNAPTAIIIDDEKHAREGLSALLRMYCPDVAILGDADNIHQGTQLIQAHSPDLVFLDISIGEQSGFQLLDRLPDISFQLIFTTAFSDYAIKAFRYNAIDYLLKPIQPQQLMDAVKKATETLQQSHIQEQLDMLKEFVRTEQPEKIIIPTMEGLHFIKINEIKHILGSANYSTFHLETGEKIMASKNLKYYDDLLPNDAFFRVHQSHLVNLRFIKKIKTFEGYIIELDDGSKIPLAKKRKEDLLALMKGLR